VLQPQDRGHPARHQVDVDQSRHPVSIDLDPVVDRQGEPLLEQEDAAGQDRAVRTRPPGRELEAGGVEPPPGIGAHTNRLPEPTRVKDAVRRWRPELRENGQVGRRR
jgi:hypothetical protein